MSLIFENTALAATQEQTHALVIGVGDYPHLLGGSLFASQPAASTLGLGQLTSSIHSATAFANWLIKSYKNQQAPLGSLELLLSPATSNYKLPDGTFKQVDAATTSAIKAAFNNWYTRAGTLDKNVAVFYFCGHGIESDVTLLLPEDFGSDPNNLWDNAIDFNSTWYGMGECKAQTQCYFLDCCRETPIDLLKTKQVNARSLKSTSQLQFPERDAYVLRAAPVGKKAHGPANGVSFFTEGLLECFEGLGASHKDGAKWKITTDSLTAAMVRLMKRKRLPNGLRGSCAKGGESNFTTEIHEISGAVKVMAAVVCDPAAALGDATLSMDSGVPPPLTRAPLPEAWEFEVEAGSYVVEAQFANPLYSNKTEKAVIAPPYSPVTLKVKP
jgi:hypothetical protein